MLLKNLEDGKSFICFQHLDHDEVPVYIKIKRSPKGYKEYPILCLQKHDDVIVKMPDFLDVIVLK